MYVSTSCKYGDHNSIIDEDTGLKSKSLHPQGNFPLLFFSVFYEGFFKETAGESPEKRKKKHKTFAASY